MSILHRNRVMRSSTDCAAWLPCWWPITCLRPITTVHRTSPSITAVCIFFLAIGLAYAALKLYDLPIREWLKGKLFTKSTVK